MPRPILNIKLSSKEFKEYYYLKEELVNFCKEYGLQTTGSKIDLTNRISKFLETGEKEEKEYIKKHVIKNIALDSIIEENITFSEDLRKFYKENIGKSFSFNVLFQNWLKENSGKTYKESIDAYYKILEEKKNNKKQIDKQFEYNTYIRDFFNDNKNLSLNDAIKCWKYKKSLKGNNKYDKKDLAALNIVRELKNKEYEILKDFLYEAIFIPEGVAKPNKDIIYNEDLYLYIKDFGKKDDCCLVIEDDKKIVGACWTRTMNDYGHIDDETPSLAISLYPEYRSMGLGKRLLFEMLNLLRLKGYKKVSLSVQKTNFAYKMYKYLGFVEISENKEDYIMICNL